MRIKGVVLEYHRNISVLGLEVVDYLVVNAKLARSYLLKACYHTQGCGLATARRTDEYDKFLVLDIHTEVVYCFNASVIDLENMFK